MRALLCLLAALTVTTAASRAAAADDRALEYAVKAAFLVKFGAYVDWPDSAFASATSPLTLCIAGDDPFGSALDTPASGQHIGARPIEVKRLKTLGRSPGCQIVYIAGTDGQSVAQALDMVRGQPILTVTEAARGDAAGIIHFVVSDGRVRFTIDDQSAAKDGLAISSKLLSLALSVKPRE